jgi:hypothetical protein
VSDATASLAARRAAAKAREPHLEQVLPGSLKNLSMDALVAIALAQNLSRLVPDTYLEQRAARATGKGLDEFLAQVPAVEAPETDRLPSDYRPKK